MQLRLWTAYALYRLGVYPAWYGRLTDRAARREMANKSDHLTCTICHVYPCQCPDDRAEAQKMSIWTRWKAFCYFDDFPRHFRKELERQTMFSDNMGPASDPYWQAQKIDRISELYNALKRVTDCLAIFVRESSDPGVEALAALDEARRLL